MRIIVRYRRREAVLLFRNRRCGTRQEVAPEAALKGVLQETNDNGSL